MLFIYDKSAVQARTKWRITDKDIIKKKKELTYFSPGGYSFKDSQGRVICFDWSDSCANYNKDDNTILEVEQYSLDHDFITSSLEDDGHNDLIKEEYRLDLFKDFKELVETHCTIDIDGEEVSYEGHIECIYFELYDPISDVSVMLIGEKDER